MIYTNSLGNFEPRLSVSHFGGDPYCWYKPLEKVKYHQIICNASSSMVASFKETQDIEYFKEYPYFSISETFKEDFPLRNKKWEFDGVEDAEVKLQSIEKELKELGFAVKRKVDLRGCPTLDAMHIETQKALENERKMMQERHNSGEKGFIRYGDIPESGKSYNYRDNFYEKGVSCYNAVFYKDNTYKVIFNNVLELFGESLYRDRPVYRLYGEIVGKGSDGEPVIKVEKAIKLNEHIKVLGLYRRDNGEEFIHYAVNENHKQQEFLTNGIHIWSDGRIEDRLSHLKSIDSIDIPKMKNLINKNLPSNSSAAKALNCVRKNQQGNTQKVGLHQ